MSKGLEIIDSREVNINQRFISIVNKINEELSNNKYYSIEYYLYYIATNITTLKNKNNDFEFVFSYLIDKFLRRNSNTFRDILYNEEYGNVLIMFKLYCETIFNNYSNVSKRNQESFDKYGEFVINGKTGFSSKSLKTDEGKEEFDRLFNKEFITQTMSLLNEAVRVYQEVYRNKDIIANFSETEKITFQIKEREIIHLLGVAFNRILKDPELLEQLKLTKEEIEVLEKNEEFKKASRSSKKDEGLIDKLSQDIKDRDPKGDVIIGILHKFINTPKEDLYGYEEDRIRKILRGSDYSEIKIDDPNQALQYYSKIYTKSQAFLNFKPLEDLSMLLKLPEGYQINAINSTGNISDYGVFISKNNLSKERPFSIMTSNLDRKERRRYFESLQFKDSSEIAGLLTAALTNGKVATSIDIVPSESSESDSHGSKIILPNFSQRSRYVRASESYKMVNHCDEEYFVETMRYFTGLGHMLLKEADELSERHSNFKDIKISSTL